VSANLTQTHMNQRLRTESTSCGLCILDQWYPNQAFVYARTFRDCCAISSLTITILLLFFELLLCIFFLEYYFANLKMQQKIYYRTSTLWYRHLMCFIDSCQIQDFIWYFLNLCFSFPLTQSYFHRMSPKSMSSCSFESHSNYSVVE